MFNNSLLFKGFNVRLLGAWKGGGKIIFYIILFFTAAYRLRRRGETILASTTRLIQ